MVDYTKATGSSGTMMIRDHGQLIEFWLNAASSATFNNQMPWAYSANGGFSGWQQYGFRGGAWRLLGSVNVAGSGNVTFHLGRTGTSGLGGPTDFTVFINRAARPSPPGVVRFQRVWDTYVEALIDAGNSNLSPIDLYEFWWSTDGIRRWGSQNNGPLHRLSGLTPGTRYNFWARTHNALGWSDFGPVTSAVTLSVPGPPQTPYTVSFNQNTITARVLPSNDGGTPIIRMNMGISETASGTYTWYELQGTAVFRDLKPGRVYYIRAEAINAVGKSEMSRALRVELQAGARVNVNGIWRRAVPYVKVNGVWKLAQPYSRRLGTWRRFES